MMVLWLLAAFSLGNFVHGINRFSEPDFEAINFAEAINGHKLNGSVIKELEVTSELSCQFECVANKSCLSYNFASIQGKEAYSCQLSDSDRFGDRANFTREDGVTYRGIQVILSAGGGGEGEISSVVQDFFRHLRNCQETVGSDHLKNGFS